MSRLSSPWFISLALILHYLVPPSPSRSAPARAPVPGTVIVTPDGGSVSPTAHATGMSAAFTVKSTRAQVTTYSISCGYSGQVTSCDVEPLQVTLEENDEQEFTVYYTTGNQSFGNTLVLRATGAANDTGYYDVHVSASMIKMVTPGGTAQDGSQTIRRRTPVLLSRFLLSSGFATDSGSIQMQWQRLPSGSLDDVTAEARYNRGLIEWEVDSARALVNPGDSARVTVGHCTTVGICTIERRIVKLANDSKPLFAFSGVPLEALGGGFSAPFGPGFSVVGAEVETGFSTVPYFSRGQARSAGLVYSTRQAYPRVLVPVDLDLYWLAANPSNLTVYLKEGGVNLDSAVYGSPNCVTGALRRCRVVVKADFSASSFSTPVRKWLTVEAKVTPSGGGAVVSSADSVEVVLVDRRTTRYGAGWWPAGVSRLYATDQDRILVESNGTATVFRGNGDSLYLGPPGNFSTFKKTGSNWELNTRGSTAKVVFDTYGRLVAGIDANGNADSIRYGGTTDSVTMLRDFPVLKSISFTYTSGKLSKITSLSGDAPRDHMISIDATTNQLRLDSVSGTSFVTRYGYDTVSSGTKTWLVSRRLGVIGDTTTVAYDTATSFLRRPRAVTLPRVQDETGASVTPVIGYTAVERRGAGTVVPLDSSGPYVELKDPRGNWTRSWLNRWGQARTTWDTLGALGRGAYFDDGRVLWSEGKIPGDTTRVYYAYDGQRRLAKSWINRVETGQGILRLDSLVYDANHRVMKRVDSRGKVDSLWYDANGNLLGSKDPGGYTTRYWYLSDGRLDSILPPGSTVGVRYTYEATWKNLSGTYLGSFLLGRTFFDQYGRDSVSESKVRVKVTATDTKWQWRRVVRTYTTANAVTVTTSQRTDTCNDPCGGPPGYGTDSLHAMTIQRLFDVAGRDTARIDERGYTTRYGYDRLGRVVRRTSAVTTGSAPRDSMAYDVAGNLRKTITRRGDTIVTSYDTRNRDTSSVVPGVGTRRKQYGGPLGQVSRIWDDSSVDSIGGVNGALAFRFDRTGRLLADTAFRGTTALATTRVYDGFERDSATTDTLGQWLLRYDVGRGLPERLSTPFSDSTTYEWTGLGQASRRTVRSAGNPDFEQVQGYTSAAVPNTLSHTAGSTGWNAGKLDPEGQAGEPIDGPGMGPVWTEQYGSGVTPDSTVDSLQYDGWERLTSWRQYRSQGGGFSQIASDSVLFDRTGNVFVNGETRWYDPATNRLDSMLVGTWTWHYTYDAAGNQIVARGTKASLWKEWRYGYDAINQLRSARYQEATWPADSLISRYAYDVLGRRIAKRVYRAPPPFPGAPVAYRRFVYHGDQVVYETDSSGTVKAKYSWGPGVDNLVGFVDSAGTYYNVVQDQLGSVRGLVRRDGTWRMHQRFTPYGTLQLRDSAGALPKLRYGWTGREYDAETGFSFHRARYYDPVQRRWTQEDPIGYDAGSNLYSYVNGSVLEATDPDGLILLWVCTRTEQRWEYVGPGATEGSIMEKLVTVCTRGHWEEFGDYGGGGGPGGGGGGGGGGPDPAGPFPGEPESDVPVDTGPSDPDDPIGKAAVRRCQVAVIGAYTSAVLDASGYRLAISAGRGVGVAIRRTFGVPSATFLSDRAVGAHTSLMFGIGGGATGWREHVGNTLTGSTPILGTLMAGAYAWDVCMDPK